jgi:hypothetical protein
MNDENDREAAWLAFQENLGNRTVGEEALAERSFKAGWTALAQLLEARAAARPPMGPYWHPGDEA